MLNSNFDLRKFLTESKAPTQQIEEATLTEATVMEYIREKMDSMNNEVRSCMREYLQTVNEIDPGHEDAHAQLMNALEDFYNKLKAHFEEDAMDDAGEQPLDTTVASPEIPVEEAEGPVYPEDKHTMTPDEFGGEEDELDEAKIKRDLKGFDKPEHFDDGKDRDKGGKGKAKKFKIDEKSMSELNSKEALWPLPEEWYSKYYTVDFYADGPRFFNNETGEEVSYKDISAHYEREAEDYSNTVNEDLNESDYEPRTKEDLIFKYLRDAWQFGATNGKDVNPDEGLSQMADALVDMLSDYDSAKKAEKPKEKSAFEKRLEKLAAAEKERRANLKEETLNEDAGMYQPIVDGIMNLTNNKETALLIAGLVKTAVNVGTVPALAAALYVHKDKPLVRKVLDLPVMKKAIDFVKDED